MKKIKEVVVLQDEGGKFSFNKIIFILLIFAILLYFVLNTNISFFSDINKFINPYIGFFEKLLVVLIILLLTYLFLNVSKKLLKGYLTRSGRSKRNIKLFLTIYEYFVWFVAIILTFSIVLKQGASLITSIGLIGFGLTLALQKPILNFAGWLVIIFSRTYKIGDVIMINNVFGKVYDIRVMYTHVSELNSDGDSTGKAILIPNEFIFTHAIINYTKGTGFIWDSIAVHLTYKSDWKKSIKTIERIVQDYYDKNIKKEVESTFKGSFKGYEKIKARIIAHERGITIKVRYLVSFEKANDIKDELMMIILEKLKKEEVIFGKVENVS